MANYFKLNLNTRNVKNQFDITPGNKKVLAINIDNILYVCDDVGDLSDDLIPQLSNIHPLIPAPTNHYGLIDVFRYFMNLDEGGRFNKEDVNFKLLKFDELQWTNEEIARLIMLLVLSIHDPTASMLLKVENIGGKTEFVVNRINDTNPIFDTALRENHKLIKNTLMLGRDNWVRFDHSTSDENKLCIIIIDEFVYVYVNRYDQEEIATVGLSDVVDAGEIAETILNDPMPLSKGQRVGDKMVYEDVVSIMVNIEGLISENFKDINYIDSFGGGHSLIDDNIPLHYSNYFTPKDIMIDAILYLFGLHDENGNKIFKMHNEDGKTIIETTSNALNGIGNFALN